MAREDDRIARMIEPRLLDKVVPFQADAQYCDCVLALALLQKNPTDKQAMARIRLLIGEGHPLDRMGNIFNIGKIGTLAKPIVPLLFERLEDAFPEVRKEAYLSLRKIDKEASRQANYPAKVGKCPIGIRLETCTSSDCRLCSRNDQDKVVIMRTKIWPAIWSGVLIAAAVAAVCLEPTHVMRGLLRNESFYGGRSTSYWRARILERFAEDDCCDPLPLEPELGKELDPDTVGVLAELLHDEDSQVCFFACNSLRALGPKAAVVVPTLRQVLRHPDVYHRRNAAGALAAIGPGARDAVPELIQALAEDDSYVNYFAAVALGNIGHPAAAARPALQKLAGSERAKQSYLGEDVRVTVIDPATSTLGYAANWALEQIGPF